ncbi:Uncharacterised protein [Vibrio cholerae]|nr:Uncharacterised protein [Vibrio cholerae]CSI82582.1 Uncharacterised protein [Vibrio cholerae]
MQQLMAIHLHRIVRFQFQHKFNIALFRTSFD